MDQKSPKLIHKTETNTSVKFNESIKHANENDPIFDTRYQSYLRFYIFDLINADTCEELNNNSNNQDVSLTKRSVIKINDIYLCKVCICGNIVGIYESQKYYRLKIDDSTGCINVTLWRDSIFNESSLDHLNSNIKSQFSELYDLLDSVKTRIKENTINNSIMYEPKQGDLVMIRAYVRCYKQRVELNAVSCTRVQSSTEELVHLILPSCLSDKVYSIPPPKIEDYETNLLKINNNKLDSNELKNIENKENRSDLNLLKENENFLNFVLKKLVQMSSSNVLDSSRKLEQFNNISCESYALFSFLRNNCPNEFKFVTHKQVLEALKELEQRGFVYSCEDEFHYLPML